MKKLFSLFLALMASISLMATEGALKGRFTINDAGDQIVFSKGNLQYNADTDTWRFAEHQYDYVGDATSGNVYVNETKSNNSLISATYDGWIDLFGWGTSGYNSRYPYLTSTNAGDYGNPANPWSDIIGTDYDWGVYNAAQLGEGWYIPTIGIWGTLFGRTDLIGRATVCGVHGFVLLPDNWVVPTEATWTLSAENWSTNVYDEDTWALMEEAGAVFLPAAGLRSGTGISDAGNKGEYCSGSYSGKSYVWSIEFYETGHTGFDYYTRYTGMSVRLIHAAPTTPTAIDNTSINLNATKRIVNGQLLIEKNGKFYNATGAEVK